MFGHSGQPLQNIVNIGIGGSDLGPNDSNRSDLNFTNLKMLKSYFVSNVDATHLVETLKQVKPENTFYCCLKTFILPKKQWPMQNLQKKWLIDYFQDENAVASFCGYFNKCKKVVEFGIPVENMFEFWDWVGGRYSLWSSIVCQ